MKHRHLRSVSLRAAPHGMPGYHCTKSGGDAWQEVRQLTDVLRLSNFRCLLVPHISFSRRYAFGGIRIHGIDYGDGEAAAQEFSTYLLMGDGLGRDRELFKGAKYTTDSS